MGVLANIFKARDKPENRTAGSAYTFYMGGTTSGKAVTERSAMQMTAVYSWSVSWLKLWQACLCIFINITMTVARKKPSTIRFTDCSMMSRIRK